MMRDCFPAHGTPCERCGVRPDVACRHRAADPGYRPPVQDDAARQPRKGPTGFYFSNRQIMTGSGTELLQDVLRNRRRQGAA